MDVHRYSQKRLFKMGQLLGQCLGRRCIQPGSLRRRLIVAGRPGFHWFRSAGRRHPWFCCWQVNNNNVVSIDTDMDPRSDPQKTAERFR